MTKNVYGISNKSNGVVRTYVKASVLLHISEFRVPKYADNGGFPLSLKFYIVYALVFVNSR